VWDVTIGEYALIGSGEVVTKDVPSYSLVICNPRSIVGRVDKKGEIVD
jgi:UDP-2-acetamido-3-amino-2,3-dideoxy-glucuronate N-acetyltransferase